MINQEQDKTSEQTLLAPFLLRVAGLSIDLMKDLRFPISQDSIGQILSLEELLQACKEELVEVLHQEVNWQKDDQYLRRTLLALKRDVFNMRPPRAHREVLSQLSEPTRVRLEEWFLRWESLQQAQREYMQVFPQELRERRLALKRIAGLPDLRKGILLVSAVLDRVLTDYQKSEGVQLNRQERTTERSLLEYLQRAACKTSPFSTFTAVCVGRFDAGLAAEEPAICYQFEHMEKASSVKLNIALLSRISSLLLTKSEILRSLPCQITFGWQEEEERIKYVRRVQDEHTLLGEEAAGRLVQLHESVFYLPKGRVLQLLQRILGDKEKQSFSDVVNHLSTVLQAGKEAIEGYLQHLLRLGFLLVPDLRLDIHESNPLVPYRQHIAALHSPTATELAGYLSKWEDELAEYTTATLEQRRSLLESISHSTEQCRTALGGMTFPHALLYEDAILYPNKLSANTAIWTPLLDQLREIQHILPLFDQTLEQKILTRGYFLARYGAGASCNDIFSFVESFLEDFYQQYINDNQKMKIPNRDPRNYFNQAEIRWLEQARKALSSEIGKAYAELPQLQHPLTDRRNEENLTLLPNLTDMSPSNISSMPARGFTNFAQTFFVQLAGSSDNPFLVVNRVYAGLGMMFSRFIYSLRDEDATQLTTQLRAYLRSQQPPGAVFAELRGGYESSNLNLHPLLTAYELVMPGDVCHRPHEEQILLNELVLRDDEADSCLKLYSERLGKEVIPLYLGVLLPAWLPEIQQVLLKFSPCTMYSLDWWRDVEVAECEPGIRFYPRLRYKDVVLQRAQWKLAAQALPQRQPGQTDAAFYLDVMHWQRRHGFPTHIFVAPEQEAFWEAVKERSAATQRDFFKPLAVDFASYLSVSLLEYVFRNAPAGLVISEMLPEQEQLWLEHQGQRYVTEFALDVPVDRDKPSPPYGCKLV